MTRKLRAKTFQKNLYFILYHLKSHTRPKNTYIKLSPPSHLGFQTRMSCPNAFCPAEKGPFPKSPLAALRSSTHPQRRPSQPPRMHAPPSSHQHLVQTPKPEILPRQCRWACWQSSVGHTLPHSRFTISHVTSQQSPT
jgi:hypothetical protein